jgi:hypothetical protein
MMRTYKELRTRIECGITSGRYHGLGLLDRAGDLPLDDDDKILYIYERFSVLSSCLPSVRVFK